MSTTRKPNTRTRQIRADRISSTDDERYQSHAVRMASHDVREDPWARSSRETTARAYTHIDERTGRHSAGSRGRGTSQRDIAPTDRYRDYSRSGDYRRGVSGRGSHSAPEKAGSSGGSVYIPALDGLRTLAVLAVIGYHLGYSWDKGGLLGVTIFFVLSGFLITGILVGELQERGTIRLGRFWLRRVRRLLPAIICVVFITCALCTIFNHQLLTKMRPDILPSLVWVQNWWYIFRDLSYFDALGDPSPLTHFWSLAIEEQFYLVWPLILLLVAKLGGTKKFIRRGCLVLAVASALWMALAYDPQADPTRVYYGTDTRAFSLLIGGWLSIAWPAKRFSGDNAWRMESSRVGLLNIVGIVGLIGLLILMVLVSGTSSFMYYGGILLASVLSAALIACLVHPNTLLARFFSLPPLVWLGKRSYGMYLWHYPIILLLKPLNTNPGGTGYVWWVGLLALALTIGVSALQYKFVENPIRHGAIGDWVRRRREAKRYGEPLVIRWPKVFAYGIPALLVLAISFVGIFGVESVSAVPEDAIQSTGIASDQAMDLSTINQTPQMEVTEDVAATEDNIPEDIVQTGTATYQEGFVNPLIIGDSVPGDVDFSYHYPHGLNDSYIGRWTWEGVDVTQQYLDQGGVGPVIVFACFSNHALQDGDLERLYEVVGQDYELFLVTVQAPYDLMWMNNEAIWSFADQHDNVHVIDWAGAINDGHLSEWAWDDETHVTPEGAEAYVNIVAASIDAYLPPEDIG